MLDGKREGWIECSVVVDGGLVSTEPPTVRATTLRELRAFRRQLIGQPGAKLEGRELTDGDIVVDFHRDEPGEAGGVESFVLDPVAFSASNALEIFPRVIGIPREKLEQMVSEIY